MRDSGPGIDPALHARVFDEFFQVGNASRNRDEGLGLGLAIVQRLSRLIGAQVQLRSATDRGTVFAVSLDRIAPTAPRRPRHAAPVTARLGLRALVLEDDGDARGALADLLQQWGCDVAAAAHSEDMPLADDWQPDVALLDMRLPGGRDGIDEAARLRARHGTTLPCLLITGESAPASLRRIEASGLPWLHKPVPVDRLLAWLVAQSA